MLEKLRFYWNIGMDKYAYCFTKHQPTIHHCQMRPSYIHSSNLVSIIPQTIRLCKGVLNRFPFTKSCINSLKMIRSEPQSMTEECPTVRWLNRSKQYIMYLVNISSYSYETHYNSILRSSKIGKFLFIMVN